MSTVKKLGIREIKALGKLMNYLIIWIQGDGSGL